MPSAGHKATKLNPRTEFYTAEKAWLAQLQKGEVPLKQ
jgi:hypothetical protein